MRAKIPACVRRWKKLQAHRARRLFQIVTQETDVAAHCRETDKRGVLARLFAAQLVIQMQHGLAQIPTWSEILQNVQQAHRVGASGDRHSHALARLKHAITGYRFRDLLVIVAHALLRAAFPLMGTPGEIITWTNLKRSNWPPRSVCY